MEKQENSRNVWVFIEQEEGRIADVSLELLAKGTDLAQTLGSELWALLCGYQIEELAETFKVLSDPTRLRLVKLLSECSPGQCDGALCVNALAHQLGVTQSAVSQHLRILRQTGLVRGERHGNFMHYSLDPNGLDRYRAALRDTLGKDFITG